MNITNILSGTISFPPGADAERLIELSPDLPTGQLPDWFFSYVRPADPANNGLFTFEGVSSKPAPTSLESYKGTRYLGIAYTSTASGPIDVAFMLVWTDTPTPSIEQYQGD